MKRLLRVEIQGANMQSSHEGRKKLYFCQLITLKLNGLPYLTLNARLIRIT